MYIDNQGMKKLAENPLRKHFVGETLPEEKKQLKYATMEFICRCPYERLAQSQVSEMLVQRRNEDVNLDGHNFESGCKILFKSSPLFFRCSVVKFSLNLSFGISWH